MICPIEEENKKLKEYIEFLEEALRTTKDLLREALVTAKGRE